MGVWGCASSEVQGQSPWSEDEGDEPPPPEAEEVFIFHSLIFHVYVILLYCVLHLVKSD